MLEVKGTPERLIIRCNRCPVQMDLGPAQIAQRRGATPTGWIRITAEEHICPTCANKQGPLIDFSDTPAEQADRV